MSRVVSVAMWWLTVGLLAAVALRALKEPGRNPTCTSGMYVCVWGYSPKESVCITRLTWGRRRKESVCGAVCVCHAPNLGAVAGAESARLLPPQGAQGWVARDIGQPTPTSRAGTRGIKRTGDVKDS